MKMDISKTGAVTQTWWRCVSLGLAVILFLGGANGEIFDSSVTLLRFVRGGEMVADRLMAMVEAEQLRLNQLKSLVSHFKETAIEDARDAEAVVEHPVRAFSVLSRWIDILALTSSQPNFNDFQNKVKKDGVTPPSVADYDGMARVLVRLQRAYHLNVSDIVAGTIQQQPSHPLRARDIHALGLAAGDEHEYGMAVQWFQDAVSRGHSEGGFFRTDVLLTLASTQLMLGDHASAVQAAEEAHHIAPQNSTLQQQLNFYRDQYDFAVSSGIKPRNATNYSKSRPQVADIYEELCRGEETHQDPVLQATLYCRYRPSSVPYYLTKEEILSHDPRIAILYDVISDREAEVLKKLASTQMKKAKVGNAIHPSVAEGRVARLSWVWDANWDRTVRRMSSRIGQITALDTAYRDIMTSAEPFQVVNYGVGGQYEPHTDFYRVAATETNHAFTFLRGTGDRIATFMLYLNDVTAGGATVFPNANVRIPPVKNAAAFWYNLKRSGDRDYSTLHAGCPVLLGQKWVANKWIREKGQEFRRPCGLSRDSAYED